MIKTDILVCDDITKEKAFFTAKDLQEVKKVMQEKRINKCNVIYTFCGMDALKKTITLQELIERGDKSKKWVFLKATNTSRNQNIKAN